MYYIVAVLVSYRLFGINQIMLAQLYTYLLSSLLCYSRWRTNTKAQCFSGRRCFILAFCFIIVVTDIEMRNTNIACVRSTFWYFFFNKISKIITLSMRLNAYFVYKAFEYTDLDMYLYHTIYIIRI